MNRGDRRNGDLESQRTYKKIRIFRSASGNKSSVITESGGTSGDKTPRNGGKAEGGQQISSLRSVMKS